MLWLLLYTISHLLKKLCEETRKYICREAFILTHIFTISSAFYFLLWIWVTIWFTLLSAWRTPFSTSCRADLPVTNPLRSVYLEDLNSHLKDSFVGYKIVIVRGFFYLKKERGRGEEERERNTDVRKKQLVASRMHQDWGTEPATQACALTGNWTGEFSLCGRMPSRVSHTSQGC